MEIAPDTLAEAIESLRWFVDRRFPLQSKFDLWGPADTAAAMKPALARAGKALKALEYLQLQNGSASDRETSTPEGDRLGPFETEADKPKA